MNREDILKAIEPMFGEEFNTYSFGGSIYRLLVPEFVKIGVHCDYSNKGYITYDTDHQTIFIRYIIDSSKYNVMAIKVKKEKGKYHSGYFGGSYDWKISDFDVDVYGTDGTVEARIKELEAVAAQYRKNKDDHQTELAGVVKLIMKETGKSFREVMNFAQDINKYRYSDDFEKKCLQNN